ncbi:hypothetical protein [Thermodesulfovibrio thiophilus]|uniref:hypothetical protein n=1 Tax=Thermodesulfovibrio thiophilus TaxID=340095 RepID=UPI0004163659|nr:hypothetical protein [Thermodesulfovibrio thiophilus]
MYYNLVKKSMFLFFALCFILVSGVSSFAGNTVKENSQTNDLELLRKVIYKQFPSVRGYLLKEEKQYDNVTVYMVDLYVDASSDRTVPVLVYKIGNNFFVNGSFLQIDTRDGFVEDISLRLMEIQRQEMQEEIKQKLPVIYSKLNKDRFIKIGNGKGTNEAIAFVSLGCPHCRHFLSDLITKKYDGTFYLIINGDDKLLKYILCSANKEKAISNILNNKVDIKKINSLRCNIDVGNYLQYYNDIAMQLNINGVPSFIMKKCILSGYYPGVLDKIKECQ